MYCSAYTPPKLYAKCQTVETIGADQLLGHDPAEAIKLYVPMQCDVVEREQRCDKSCMFASRSDFRA